MYAAGNPQSIIYLSKYCTNERGLLPDAEHRASHRQLRTRLWRSPWYMQDRGRKRPLLLSLALSWCRTSRHEDEEEEEEEGVLAAEGRDTQRLREGVAIWAGAEID